jgi:hypothetical protein
MGIFAKRYTNPVGMKSGGSVQAPRTTNVRGQHHKLAYINNEEEALLRARGGTGQAGPGGIPAFPRGSVSKDKVDKATGAKSSSSSKTVTNTGSRGSETSRNNTSNSNTTSTGGRADRAPSNNSGGGNNNNSGNGGNPGDRAGGGYGGGNSGGNAGSSPPSSTPSGPSQAEINEQNRINRERAQAEADRRAAQDQAIRDQIEEDRRMQRNRDIVAQQQQQPTTSFDNFLAQAQNVRAFPPPSDGNNFDPYQVATTEGNAFDLAVEQSLAADKKEAEKARLEQAGFTIEGENVRDANGAFVGKLSDPLGKLMAGGTGYSDYDDYKKKFGNEYQSNLDKEAYSNYEDYLKRNPTAQPETVPTTTVPATGIASVGTDYGYETNQKRLDKYKLDPKGYEANDTSKEARLWRARNGGMSETDNPRLDKDGKPVAAKDAKYLDAADWADGGGPGRAGPEFQTKFQSVNNTWAGQEGDTGNIGSTLGITPTGSGRDPTGVAAFVDKGGILGALAGAVLGPNSYVPPNTATTNIDSFGNDNNDEPSLSGPPVGGPPAGAPTCPEGYRFDSATNACVLGDASNTDPFQPIITPYTPPPLSAYTPFQPNAPFQPNFQTPSYLPQMPVQQAGIMASTPTQRYLGTA